MPETNYIWDEVNDTLLMEKDEAGNTTAAYTHEPGQYGPLTSLRRDGQTHFHHFDAQGSTRQLTDANQNVTDSYAYTAFGERIASSGATANPFGYKGALGYYTNPESNDLYVRARSYSPCLTRWLSRDRLGVLADHSADRLVDNTSIPRDSQLGHLFSTEALSLWEGEHLYQYVNGNPLMYLDPGGLKGIKLQYPVVCNWCRMCSVSFLTQCLTLVVFTPQSWKDCTGPTVVACPLPIGRNGKPIVINGRPYLEPRKCCESHRPTSVSLKCTWYWEEEWAVNPPNDPPGVNCDTEMLFWISQAGGGKGSAGYLSCLAWCEKCIARIGIEDGRENVIKEVLKEKCISTICDNSFN